MKRQRREFKNLARVIKENRVKQGISQVDLSLKLGYKNGQFVSNIERSICSIPHKSIKTLCEVLKVDKTTVVDAMTEDYRHNSLILSN